MFKNFIFSGEHGVHLNVFVDLTLQTSSSVKKIKLTDRISLYSFSYAVAFSFLSVSSIKARVFGGKVSLRQILMSSWRAEDLGYHLGLLSTPR